MIHCGFNKNSIMTNSTPVQNIFLIEYMPKAPENYVKVYLYGLLQCGCRAMESTDMAFALGMDEGKVTEAFLYWQDRGLVKIASTDPLCVEYANPLSAPAPVSGERKYARLVDALRTVAGERLFTPQELSKIFDWIEIFGMEEAAALMLVRHCMNSRGAKVRIQYMDKVAKTWAEDGILTPEAAESRIRQESELQGGARDILNRWRKSRMATEDELALYKKWTEEWGMSHADILAACPAVTSSDKPTFAYLNGVLEGMRKGGGVQQYLKEAAMVDELAREAFVRAGIKHPATRRDKEQFAQWALSWHMDTEAILLASEYSAGSSRPMDSIKKLMEEWRQQGISSVSAAKKYRQQSSQTDRKAQGKTSYYMNYDQRRYGEDALRDMGLPMPGEDEQ